MEEAKVEMTLYSKPLMKLQDKFDEVTTWNQGAKKATTEEKERSVALATKLEAAKVKITVYQAREEDRCAVKKRAYLESPEFFDLQGAHLASLWLSVWRGYPTI